MLLQVPYSLLHSNSEAAAVWCKTGCWSTQRASTRLTGPAILEAGCASYLRGAYGCALKMAVPVACCHLPRAPTTKERSKERAGEKRV